jgi:hypothetical protein
VSLPVYVLYRDDAEFPGDYVVRTHEHNADGDLIVGAVPAARHVEREVCVNLLLSSIPGVGGMTYLARTKDDDPSIAGRFV